MATWRKLLEKAMRSRGESLSGLEASTLSDADMDVEFHNGYGGPEGKPFTAWSAKAVYFPVCYDGSEWVGSVSRHPDGKPTQHHGGG